LNKRLLLKNKVTANSENGGCGGCLVSILVLLVIRAAFSSPFAAYLIPKDIKMGERVLLADLIEDYMGASWNQGDTYGLESCEALLNGKDLEIQYDQRVNRSEFVGQENGSR